MKRNISIKRVLFTILGSLAVILLLASVYLIDLPGFAGKQIDKYSRYSFVNILKHGRPCIKEAMRGSYTYDKKVNCCPGLAQSSITVVNKEKEEELDFVERCSVMLGGGFICINCGNGICGPGENSCNCEEDCFNIN